MKNKKQNAVVYCEGAFNTTNGKTAHGLVRFSGRYNVVAVMDSTLKGRDAGVVLDGINRDVPLVKSVEDAFEISLMRNLELTHFVVGLAPDGGRLGARARDDIVVAIEFGLNVDCGLHDFLTDDAELVSLAADCGVELVFVLGHPSYYPRFGFRPAGVRGFRAPYPIPDENADAWMVKELKPGVMERFAGTVECASVLMHPAYWIE